ncbi:MAG: cysteine--tRNA ligase [Myxococcales bacterium]|nr:cysteine--tRNA ligase [Myxococcales bacterium]
MPEPFKLYNTLTRKVEDFEPQQPGHVGLYVCGMTVYDHCHVGHARAMVVFDTFVRYLRHRSWDVTFVRNFTDVDDKIIARANQCGEPSADLAQRYIDAFGHDMTALGLLTPDQQPRVTESMDAILEMISALVADGHAYAADGSVWFSVKTFDEYGKLSGRKVDELRSADEGVPGKADPADFAVWKASKPGEPSWPSPWGPGRPGWHIECSAMAKATLGATIDIHGGGLDLVFPHHENEIAQSECGNHAPYVRYWMHNGLLNVASGQKMGKSLGNVVNIEDAVKVFPAEAIRLYYLQNHYRSPLPWDDTALSKALSMLARIYEAREAAEAMNGAGAAEDLSAANKAAADKVSKELGAAAIECLQVAREFEARFYTAMDNDFNTAQALGHVFELARAVNRLANHKKAKKRGGPIAREALAAFELLATAMGLCTASSAEFQAEVKRKRLGVLGVTVQEIEALLEQRTQARADKDWARADAIREALEAKNIVVMDSPEGVDWRIRV